MKQLKISSILFLVSLLILSCGNSKTNTENKKKQRTALKKEYKAKINFIGTWLNEGKREDLIRNLVREYEFKNQDIEVNFKFPEDIYYNTGANITNQMFVADIIEKETPEWDIIRILDDYDGVFKITNDPKWAAKHLVDFSAIPEFRENTKEFLLSDSIKNRWGGIIPGPFIEGQYWAVWYNKNVADRIGIEIKNQNMTVDDFISYVSAVSKYNQQNPSNTITPIHEAGDWQTVSAVFFHMFASSFTNISDFLSTDYSKEKYNNWEKILQVAEELSKYEPLDKDYKNSTWTGSTNALLNEECLFYINGSWMYNIWLGIDPAKTLNCVPTELPTFKAIDSYPGGYQIMWAVLKNAPNKDAAIDFLLDMNNAKTASTWVKYTKSPTGIKNNMAEMNFGADQFESFSSYIQKRYKGNYKYSEDASYILGEKNQNVYLHLRDVLTGSYTAKEAMEMIKSQLITN